MGEKIFKNVFTVSFYLACSVAICWMCKWNIKVIVGVALFWFILVFAYGAATLSDYIAYRKAIKDDKDEYDSDKSSGCQENRKGKNMSYSRFDTSIVGSHYNPSYLLSLSDEELAAEIKELDYWDYDLCRDLCYRADMLDEFMATEKDFDEELLQKAAEKLGVEIF